MSFTFTEDPVLNAWSYLAVLPLAFNWFFGTSQLQQCRLFYSPKVKSQDMQWKVLTVSSPKRVYYSVIQFAGDGLANRIVVAEEDSSWKLRRIKCYGRTKCLFLSLISRASIQFPYNPKNRKIRGYSVVDAIKYRRKR